MIFVRNLVLFSRFRPSIGKFDAWLSGNWIRKLFCPIDASSLVFLRIAFGLIMLVEMWRYYDHDWITRYFVDPDFMFNYFGFGWVHPWPGDGMYWHFGLLTVLSVCIAIGFMYRVATVLFLIAFTYVFLLEEARYLNHFYFVIILAFLLAITPANRYFSVDSRIWPSLRSETVPAWTLWLVRAQIEIFLIYAGLVKINPDWLRLEPLGMWLSRRDDWPLIGPLFNEDWVVATASYGSIAIHVVGAPLLLFRRTRVPAIVAYFCFHLSNHFLFSIGIFPWLAMATTLMFLDPDWPKQLMLRIRGAFRIRAITRAAANG